jgi:hypothetical protein
MSSLEFTSRNVHIPRLLERRAELETVRLALQGKLPTPPDYRDAEHFTRWAFHSSRRARAARSSSGSPARMAIQSPRNRAWRLALPDCSTPRSAARSKPCCPEIAGLPCSVCMFGFKSAPLPLRLRDFLSPRYFFTASRHLRYRSSNCAVYSSGLLAAPPP